MGKLRRILSLSPADFLKITLLSFLLAFAAVKIHFLSQEKIIRSLQSPASNPLPRKKNPSHLEKWLRLLETADRSLGWKSSCLRRAVVLSWLSRLWQMPVQFQIGVRREGGVFEAHAWLETEGMRLEIQPTADRFTPLRRIPSS